MTHLSRRSFVAAGGAAAAAAALPAAGPRRDPIRIALVGCGGRGTGAAENCLTSTNSVELVAMADMFEDRLADSRKYLGSIKHSGVKVEDKDCYTGWDAYKRVLDRKDVDLALFATPPGFRPMHIEAAIEAGKNVFMEKPVAVDPVGVRRVIAAGEKAKAKKLAMVAGTQYRHHDMFMATIQQVHEGRIGKLLSVRCYYNSGELWFKKPPAPPAPPWTPMENQVRNWIYYCWLSGDQPAEQHIHTIDVVNWGLQAHPLFAVGAGGRQVRTGEKFGNVYDHFGIDFEYPGGVHVASFCRQQNRTATHVGAYFHGEKGMADPYKGVITGENPWKFDGPEASTKIEHSYVQEHRHLIESIREGKPLNEARQVAESTLTAIVGREAAYTGKRVLWEEMMESDLDLSPKAYAWGEAPNHPVPAPGKPRL